MIKKKKIAILGDPVAHSLSPAMQNAAFRSSQLPFQYSKIRLRKNQLKTFFKKVSPRDYVGFNVTVPHKEVVIPFLDQLSPEAKLIGAVNTIAVRGGQWKGFNTDGMGYLVSLQKEAKFHPKGKQVVVLGAGGAARAIVALLCLKGVRRLFLVNRTFTKAQTMAREFQTKFPRIFIRPLPLSHKNLSPLFQKTDLLVNTTSASLKGNSLPNLPLEQLSHHALVSDIVYKPAMTPFLKKAKTLRLKIHQGLGMLLYQGALAFQIWTGKKAPLGVMRRALLQRGFR